MNVRVAGTFHSSATQPLNRFKTSTFRRKMSGISGTNGLLWVMRCCTVLRGKSYAMEVIQGSKYSPLVCSPQVRSHETPERGRKRGNSRR